MPPALPARILYLVTDRAMTGGDAGLVAAVSGAVAGGVNMVQLREKDLSHVELLRMARALRKAIGDRALLIVNGDPLAAAESGADGVQLGEEAASVKEARETLGRDLLIGRSVHSAAGAAQAEKDGADFLVLGAVFPSQSHPAGQTLGVAGMRQAAASVRVPVIGIGGITAANAASVIASGAHGVAVISAILGAPDPEKAARSLCAAIRLRDRA
jgi:thiamine-phosphate pyrophosphorylase